ncbi:PREDICTED: uncharacterized protein LOC106115453 [Papilio xuthus]|uniref:Uncharacterized protein LOC106115453 n=2 Tax=Papilio xuthus TaxID=66420 RepID=A0AAJ6Z2P0_PAPXU|nr:PREDICTED: uncharacterized protein LOC106115453 [Papilio xuthus]
MPKSKSREVKIVHSDKRIAKLDDESLRNLTDSDGPCNECICNLIDPPKPPFDLRNAIRSAIDTLQMYTDSTAKALGITSSTNLAGPSEKGKEKEKAKGGKKK